MSITLNQRAAKYMGWKWTPNAPDESLDFYGRVMIPTGVLDDAALVRDRAIEVCGFLPYLEHLHAIVRGIPGEPCAAYFILHHQLTCEGVAHSLFLATPAQITEAAVRCLEAHKEKR